MVTCSPVDGAGVRALSKLLPPMGAWICRPCSPSWPSTFQNSSLPRRRQSAAALVVGFTGTAMDTPPKTDSVGLVTPARAFPGVRWPAAPPARVRAGLRDLRRAPASATRFWSATRCAATITQPGTTVKGPPGWWDTCIGPGKAIDTNHFLWSASTTWGLPWSTGLLSSTRTPARNTVPTSSPVPATGTARQCSRTFWEYAVGRGHRRQPGRDAGHALGLEYPDRVRHCVVIAAAEAQRPEHRLQRSPGHRLGPDFHDGHYRLHGSVPQRVSRSRAWWAT